MVRFRRRGRDGKAASADPSVDAPPLVTGVSDPGVAAALERDGYARLGGCLSDEDVSRCRELFEQAVGMLDRPLGDEWFPTALWPEDAARDHLTSGLREVVAPLLERVVDPASTELMRLDCSVKPPSPTSELGPHQDFAIVDEARATSLYVWMPLSDSNLENGTLHVVPGSHRFTNRVRSRHVPAIFDEVLDDVRREAVRLDCAAGELVVMVSGLIHFSPPNLSPELRLAVHGIVKPSGVPLVFYYADERTPPGMVECYELDIEQYVRCITAGRPGDDVPMDGLVPCPELSMTPSRFAAGMAAHRRASAR